MDDKVGDRGVESEHPNAAVLKPLSLSPPLSTSQIFLWSIIVITLLMCLGNLSKGFGKWVAGPLSLMIQAFLLWVREHQGIPNEKVATPQKEQVGVYLVEEGVRS